MFELLYLILFILYLQGITMMRKIIPVLIALLISSPVLASKDLSADEVKALFTNKTFDVHNVAKGKDLKGYDSDDGTHLIYIPWKDKISKRKWWVEDNKHCTSHPKRGDNCKVMRDMGDGIYHGISDGEHTHTLSNFRDGNQLK
jgi:hypothetical protein